MWFSAALPKRRGSALVRLARTKPAVPFHCPAARSCAGGAFTSGSGTGDFPVVDCAPLLRPRAAGKDAERERALNGIRSAFENRGFFYASGVSVLPSDYIAGVYDFAERAHTLPADVKSQWKRLNGPYSGADVGEFEADYEAGTKSSVRARDYQREGGTRTYAYPGEGVVGQSYDEYMDSLYSRQDELSNALFTAAAEMYGMDADTFTKHCTGDMGTIRLLHYPGLKQGEEADTGISAHTDFETFTLMHQNASGLQLIPRNTGAWVDAPVRPGEFIVILGD